MSRVKGMRELERTLMQLERLPQTIATKSARAGGMIALRATRANAPVDEGDLKRGLVLRRERTRIKGKSVYQVTFSAAFNNVYVKLSKAGKRSYYPASQEYGFLTVDGGYIPGYRYMRQSADSKSREVERKILSTTGVEVDKALRKR